MPLDKRVQECCRRLRENDSTLRSISLVRVEIGDAEALALADALKENDKLQHLSLWCTRIGIEGGIALADVLLENSTLRWLHVKGYKYADCNKIGPEGGMAIGRALSLNTSLKVLELECNQIGDEAVKEIAEALKTNTTLKHLILVHNTITTEGAHALLQVIQEHNVTLTYLDLHGNYDISVPIKQQIEVLVEQNRNRAQGPALPTPEGAHHLVQTIWQAVQSAITRTVDRATRSVSRS